VVPHGLRFHPMAAIVSYIGRTGGPGKPRTSIGSNRRPAEEALDHAIEARYSKSTDDCVEVPELS
jgi:hypothetical protein